MRIPFRQGIVRHQSDSANNPTFLQVTPSGVNLYVSPDPTLIAFAQGINDVLFEERETIAPAWTGPFVAGTDYWIYWDIDVITGMRTFGHTLVQPIDDPNPPAAPIAVDQHWFDIREKVMKVYINNRWVEKYRVFAGKLASGVVMQAYTIGSQAGLNTPIRAGFLIYDDEDNVVKKFDRFNRGKFITTESALAAQVSSLSNFRLEEEVFEGEAVEHIPKHYCIAFRAVGKLALASQLKPEYPCEGISSEEMPISAARSFITQGYITDIGWNWTDVPGTRLFVGLTGELTTLPPQAISLQQVGTVVSPKTIHVNIRQIILYGDG